MNDTTNWTLKLLNAARLDIVEDLKGDTLQSRNFGDVISVAKLAEQIASADGRPDFNGVLQTVIVECEFHKHAKNLYAALAAHFADGDVVLYDKYRRLQQTHAQVEGTCRALEAAQDHLRVKEEMVESEREALAKMREALQLGSGSSGLPDMPVLPPMSEVFNEGEGSEKES